MPILALGVSHRRAPVSLLERLSFPPDDDPKAYRMLLESGAVSEAVILSTCNRVEIFAEVDSYHSGFQAVKRFLAESRDVPVEEFADPLYSHYESHAAEHLFSVAAGIDSVVVGEPQILTQVRSAYRRAQAEGTVGPVMGALFRAAIRAGKRARSETAIGAAPAGFVDAGLDLAERVLGELQGRSVAVVGAGEMARLAVGELRRRETGRLTVVGRSVERAGRVAGRMGAEAAGLDRLPAVLARADLVVSSTGATGIVIGSEAVRTALRLRREPTPLFLLDVAVPRDVDPTVRRLPDVHLADLDDLKEAIASGTVGGEADREKEMGRVRSLVAEEVARFESWRRAARLAPLIQALRDRGERVAARELERLAPRLTGLTERQREAVEALARGIVAKLLHDPIVRLKELSGPAAGDVHGRVLAELFRIEPPGE